MKKFNRNIILSILLLASIVFSVIKIVTATAPNPGHDFTKTSGGLILGDLIYGSGPDAALALAGNITVTKKFLNQTGNSSVSAAPVWSILAAGDIPDISGTYSVKAGNTSLVTVGTIGTGAWNADAIADGKIASALTGKTYNALTLTAAGTGFTIAGGTLSKTLTVTGDAIISGTPLANPMTTLGDIIYEDAVPAANRLPGNITVTKKFLNQTGNGSVSAAPVWSILAAGDIPDLSATYLVVAGTAAKATILATTRAIYGNNFDGSAALTGIIASTYGGTGNGWTKFSGPTAAEKTFTLPDINATILTSNAAVTVAQGGTGLAAITANNLIYGNGTGNALLLAPGATTGAILMNTAAGAPSWSLLSALPSTAGALPVANGGTNLAAAVSDAVLVGDSTSAYTARALPASCAGTTAKLLYDSTTNLFSCGTDQTSGGGATYVVTTADSASAAVTTYADITGLSWSLAASTRYDITCNIIYDASATTIGLGIGWTGPASPTRTHGLMVAGLSGGATVGGTASVGNDTGGTTLSSVYTASNTATFNGVWENGSNLGTLQMRFKPESATANGIIIKTGSWCKYITY